MAPDGLPVFSRQVDAGNAQQIAQAAIEKARASAAAVSVLNPFLRISLPFSPKDRAELENLLQILTILGLGKKAGIADGTFAKRLKDLSDDEALAEFDKLRRALEEEYKLFCEQYTQVGEKIQATEALIKERIHAINDEIRKIEGEASGSASGSDSGGGDTGGSSAKDTERIAELKAQKKELKSLKRDVETVSEKHAAATNAEALEKVETQVQDVAQQAHNAAAAGPGLSSGLSSANPLGDPLKGNPNAAP
jgi:archaellum component FlaC